MIVSMVLCCFGIISLSAADEDPCLSTNHLSLDDKWRWINNSNNPRLYCDTEITEAWYRVLLGNIAISDPGYNMCGTMYPIWMNDDLPSAGVTRTVNMCLRDLFSSCYKTWTIRVKNCATFYVYELHIPRIHNLQQSPCAAYCIDPAINASTSIVQNNTDNTSFIEATTDPAINTSTSIVQNNIDNTSSIEATTDSPRGDFSIVPWVGLIWGVMFIVLIIHAVMTFFCSKKHHRNMNNKIQTENDRGTIKVNDIPKTRNKGLYEEQFST